MNEVNESYWGLVHIASGDALPHLPCSVKPTGWDPKKPEYDPYKFYPPRMFTTRRAAKHFRTMWAKGVGTRIGGGPVVYEDAGRSVADLYVIKIHVLYRTRR